MTTHATRHRRPDPQRLSTGRKSAPAIVRWSGRHRSAPSLIFSVIC